jgi:putative SOS response-associated peptidase YedK
MLVVPTCGRFARTSSRDVLASEFGIATFVNVDLSPRYNIAPSQPVDAIIRHGDEKRLGPMKWGFSSANSTLASINARAETVATSPLFREAFHRRRCLVVADGFYEWQRNGRIKTPYFIHLRSARPFGFAGIFSMHRTEVGHRVATCAIVTCRANELMATIHDRMPVIVPPDARERWLDPRTGEADLRGLLVPLSSDELEAYVVATLVNSPQNDSPECVERVGA